MSITEYCRARIANAIPSNRSQKTLFYHKKSGFAANYETAKMDNDGPEQSSHPACRRGDEDAKQEFVLTRTWLQTNRRVDRRQPSDIEKWKASGGLHGVDPIGGEDKRSLDFTRQTTCGVAAVLCIRLRSGFGVLCFGIQQAISTEVWAPDCFFVGVFFRCRLLVVFLQSLGSGWRSRSASYCFSSTAVRSVEFIAASSAGGISSVTQISCRVTSRKISSVDNESGAHGCGCAAATCCRTVCIRL